MQRKRGGRISRRDRLRITDVETGEELAVIVTPERNAIGGRWVRVFQDALKALRGRKLQGKTYWILINLVSEADFQNRVPNTAEMAKKLGMEQSGVSRAYSDLKKIGVLIVKDRIFYLSPTLCWKGNQKQLEQAYEDLLSTRTEVSAKPILQIEQAVRKETGE